MLSHCNIFTNQALQTGGATSDETVVVSELAPPMKCYSMYSLVSCSHVRILFGHRWENVYDE